MFWHKSSGQAVVVVVVVVDVVDVVVVVVVFDGFGRFVLVGRKGHLGFFKETNSSVELTLPLVEKMIPEEKDSS